MKDKPESVRQFVSVLLLTVLAGCITAPKPPPVKPKLEKQSVASKPAETPQRTLPKIVVKPKPVQQPQTAAVRPAPTKATINDDPKQLYGLNYRRVNELLGSASFVRRDGPAEVWQYRAKACVLDVYLYKDAGALTVAHVDIRKRKKATEPPRQCFHKLITKRTKLS